MRDIDNYLGKKAFTATTAEGALADGVGNFDFGEKGQLGMFPDVYIICHFAASAMAASGDTVTVSVQDSANGSTWATKATHTLTGAYKAGDVARIKIPTVHERYMRVQVGYTTGSSPHAVTVEFYLERG